jgi:hypothetical protein
MNKITLLAALVLAGLWAGTASASWFGHAETDCGEVSTSEGDKKGCLYAWVPSGQPMNVVDATSLHSSYMGFLVSFIPVPDKWPLRRKRATMAPGALNFQSSVITDTALYFVGWDCIPFSGTLTQYGGQWFMQGTGNPNNLPGADDFRAVFADDGCDEAELPVQVSEVYEPDFQNHPTWGWKTVNGEGTVIMAGGTIFPGDGDPGGYDEVYYDCADYTGCDMQYREQIIINGIGGPISVYLSGTDPITAGYDQMGYNDATLYGAIIRYKNSGTVYYDMLTFRAVPTIEQGVITGWGVGGFSHETVHTYQPPSGGGGGGGGEPCFPSPLNNWCNGGGPGN